MSLDVDELSGRVEALGADGRWGELYDLLAPVDADVLVRRNVLAYRFGEALYHTARFEDLAEFARRYEKAAREDANAQGVLRALNLAFIARFETGRLDAARRKAEELMELAEAEGDDALLAKSANNMGLVFSLEGDWEQALANFQLALPLHDRTGDLRGLAQVHHNLGNAHRYLGRLDDAVDAHREAAALAGELGYPFLVAMSTVGRAEVEMLRGDGEVARRLVERGLREARTVGDPVSEADGLRVRALVRAREPDERDAALDDLRQAGRLAEETGSRLLAAEVERDTAAVLEQLGRVDDARERLEGAVAAFDALGASMHARRARSALEDLAGGA